MNYIVLDLEWNQCPYGKEKEKKGFPFEIIEIGAVKLDESRSIIGEFRRVIRPKEYKKLHFQTQKVIHITQDELDNGESFPDVLDEFFNWCNREDTFCTWGISDLMELQRNAEHYNMKNVFPRPLFYYDIQLLTSIFKGDDRKRTLENAVELFKIKKDRPFHDALDDAYYTARVMQSLEWKDVMSNYSIDCYVTPKCKEEEISAVFPTYSKYISREFSTKERAFKDKDIVGVKCYICGKPARRKVKWFASQPKLYLGMYRCPRHGLLYGRMRFKSNSEGKYFVVKTIEKGSDESFDLLLDRKEQIRIKRRNKNHGTGKEK